MEFNTPTKGVYWTSADKQQSVLLASSTDLITGANRPEISDDDLLTEAVSEAMEVGLELDGGGSFALVCMRGDEVVETICEYCDEDLVEDKATPPTALCVIPPRVASGKVGETGCGLYVTEQNHALSRLARQRRKMKKSSIWVGGVGYVYEVDLCSDSEDPGCLSAAVDRWVRRKTLEQVIQLGDSYITDASGQEITVSVQYSVTVENPHFRTTS